MIRIFAFLLVLFLCLPVFAQSEKPIVLIYENSGDAAASSFISMAREGAEQALQELGVPYTEHSLTESEGRQEVFARYARQGHPLLIGLGFQNVAAVSQVAQEFPNTQFTVVDGKIPPLFDNVQSVVFRHNEGAFLVGVIAALHSETGQIGFVGGMDAPVIRDFAYGFRQGAEYVQPNIKVQQFMIGKTKQAFNDPQTASKLAKELIDNGADVLFAAAGASTTGVLQMAARYDHVHAIGVDTNQNHLFPGTMLTSLVKRVDMAVYNTIKQSNLNTWEGGIQYLGIREGALDYAVDQHNRDLLTLKTIDSVERAKDFILQGLIKVDAYEAQ